MHGSSSVAAKLGAVALAVGVVVVPAGSAIGGGSDGLKAVSVSQLQSPAQLPQTPNASVPVPSVPHVQTPSVPSVQTPSVQTPTVPHVQPPSVPSVQTPSVPSVRT